MRTVIPNLIKNNPYLIGVGFLLIMGLAAAVIYGIHEYIQTNREVTEKLGATTERSQQQSEVLNSVEEANDARNNPSAGERDRVRSKYDRNSSGQ